MTIVATIMTKTPSNISLSGPPMPFHSPAPTATALLTISDTADEVSRLQTSLDNNLVAVASAGKFDETLLSLSTAIQLLAARANLTLTDGADSNNDRDTSKGHAA
jgi:hypothetical protein